MNYEDFNYLTGRLSDAWKFGLSKGQKDILWEHYSRVDFGKAKARVEQLIRNEKYSPSIAQLASGLVTFAPNETEILEASLKAKQSQVVLSCAYCKGEGRTPSLEEYGALVDEETREFWEQIVKRSKVTGCQRCLPICKKCSDKGVVGKDEICECLAGKIISSRSKNHVNRERDGLGRCD